MERFEKKTITLCDVNVYCEYILNHKPPIILIHGFVSSIYTYHRMIPLLSKHFSVVAIDLPGFGKSEKSKSFVYSYKNYANVVAECIKYFNLNDVIVVGHSMGGQIALNTAREIPEKVSKLILLCSSGYVKRARRSLIYCSYLPFFKYGVKHYIRRKDIKKSLENVCYNHEFITDELMNEFAAPLRDKGFPVALMRLLRYREGDLTEEELKEIKKPVLLIWGEEDKVVPLQVGKRLVQDLPQAQLVIYEKTGHLVTEEQSEAVFHQILSYTS
ncbi:alpha/beta fold hydrolase [Halalkalibacter alkalisediminis]|uniref:Alpha/beta fold hydrolase n=1 Tax=Halalkalibacter alkalisediminis TaxID=935616 RepID=A0ABV6NN01_9BACI|nr:alpha/beta hydrolase [Halalkalibacter alkalisediminis]